MAGHGPPPKKAEERRRRNADPVATTTVAADGELRGHDLPTDRDWPEATLRWWDTWRRSPQAQTFTDTDWSFLLDTAVLHAEYWMGELGVAGELRLRAAKFGATPEDRARLRLQVAPEPAAATPPAAAPAKRRASTARKDRLLKAVTDDTAAG